MRLYKFGARQETGRVAFSPDGASVIISSEALVQVWSVASGQRVWSQHAQDHTGWGKFAPQGDLVLTAADGASRLWSVQSGECLVTLEGVDSAELAVFGLGS